VTPTMEVGYIWDLVSSLVGLNLVIFVDQPRNGRVQLIRPTFRRHDPSLKSLVFVKTDQYSKIGVFDVPLVERMSAMPSCSNYAPAAAVASKLGGPVQVLHGAQVIGFTTIVDDLCGMVPCVPGPAGEGPSIRETDRFLLSGVDQADFLEAVHAAAGLPCRPKYVAATGLVTEDLLFVRCTPPFPPLPVFKPNAAFECLSYNEVPWHICLKSCM
jgi:hypothetical protein